MIFHRFVKRIIELGGGAVRAIAVLVFSYILGKRKALSVEARLTLTRIEQTRIDDAEVS